ncbi:ASCH domain-containing protein [Paenibacillus xerothermodurans]|uniref:ASCH domain-containing protein n=1 Tax=Paenibacillus xerothermodurans TaxID=1977292 RepID=A0A2W1N651_PAEXE|nr:ASCH domain-containing protein [Paenibacillus xerothermodurans]PZE19837.1 ASCH domain-containing protein [Paenibacillus xerothermodurans]
MKAISIRQPWATLVALGEKQYETRSWRTKYRGQLGIHSSQTMDKAVCKYEPVRSLLAKHGYTAQNLPTGFVIATCRLVDCNKVIDNHGTSATLDDGSVVSGNEFMLGNFGVGRFAWRVRDVEMLEQFIPAKGKLGLWELGEISDYKL